MNEEYKKKYLKYKIKYLELIGGEQTAQEKQNSDIKNKYLDTIALLNFLSELKDEDLKNPDKEYNKVFSSNRSKFFGDNGELKIDIKEYKDFLDLFKIKKLYKEEPKVNTIEGADLKNLEEMGKFPTLKNIIKKYKPESRLTPEDITYILNRINELINKYDAESIKSRFNKPSAQVKLSEKNIKSIVDHIYDDQTEMEPATGSPAAKTCSTTEKIKNLFELLKKIINNNDETAFTEMNKKMPEDIYSADNKLTFTEMNKKMPKDIYSADNKLTSFISNIAKCIGIVDSNYITKIEKYIKDNYINEIFKDDQLYKLFIFIVIEFGKQLNFEGPVITSMEKLLIDPPLNLQVI